jgi:asparagine synthase (glutamine-hydrolysing)
MSIQAGICCFDGRRVSRTEIAYLLQGLERRSPDYFRIHVSKSFGAGFRGLLIAPEDKPDQPLAGLSGSIITFDGRLDNRNELFVGLGMSLSDTVSDAMLTLIAYEKRGRGCFDQLKGEFACVIRDERSNSLFLFRSLCGTRPLFYVMTHNQIVWSSELDDLVVKSGIDPVVNDTYAIGYAYCQPDIDESPFRNVETVPPGTYIEFRDTANVSRAVPVWHPERISTLSLGSDDEYADAWRHHVQNAIASKLRTMGPVFCELSGGLDSTTLVLISDQILESKGRAISELTTTSLTFETSSTCDESYFIRIAETARGCKGIHISEHVQQPTFGLRDTAFTGAPSAHRFTPGRYPAIAEAMKLAGAHVLLTGIGGDHVFWSDQEGSPELADFLLGWRLGSLFTHASQWSKASRVPLWRILLSHALTPVAVTAGLGSWLPSEITRCPWIPKKACKWLVQAGRDQGIAINDGIDLPSRRVRETMIRAFRALLSAGHFQGHQQIYFSHPYSNQELIDFVLGLPMNQLARPGQDRFLMRRATQGLLPEAIRNRKSKATIDEAACRVLQHERDEIGDIKALEVCRRNYADPVALANAMPGVFMGRCDHSYALLRLMNLEQWLRSLRNLGTCRALSQNEESPLFLHSSPTPSSSGDSIQHSTSASPIGWRKEEPCIRHPRLRT